MASSKIPVIIGVGDFKNRSQKVEDAIEPAELMLKAIDIALSDTGLSNPSTLKSKIDSIDVVLTWTWPYPDLSGLLGEKLGVKQGLKHSFVSPHGGNQPAKLLDEAARRVSRGETGVAIVTGGEALASCMSCIFPWRHGTESGRLMEINSNCMCCCGQTATTRLDQTLQISRRSLQTHNP